MSEYEDDESDSDSGGVNDSFAFIAKVKSNTPRARFDVHFYPTFIQLIQYNVQREVSNRYRIHKENVSEMLRLPYSNGKQIFFVLHLKKPIIGGNKSTTEYDFVVFNFADEDYEEIRLDLTDTIVRDMFSDDIIESECISGQTIDVFEDMLIKIFEKDVTTPAKNFVRRQAAPALKCTFWDSDEHFLYVLDDGFINVWKYCQKIRLSEVKNVRFVQSKGRSKTFDFYIYPKMKRAIRRYNIGSSMSQFHNCFFLEFKAIDQMHYDGLYEYCQKNKIYTSTKDYKESASGSSDSDSRSSVTETETNSSGSDEANTEPLVDDFEAPDPHMVRCETEGRGSDSDNDSNENSEVSNEVDTSSLDQPPTTVTQNIDNISSNSRIRRKQRRQNIISDETSSSSSDCMVNSFKDKSTGISPRKRSMRIESDEDEVENKYAKMKNTIASESDSD